MAQLKVTANDFNLTSKWSCTYYIELGQMGDLETETYCCNQSEATTAKTTVTFPLTLPANVKINSARVHSTWSGSLHGMAIQQVNGATPSEGFVTIANPAATAASVSVEFSFKAIRDSYEAHDPEASTAHRTVNHTSTAMVKEVYLLIDYEVETTKCTPPSGVTLSSSTSTGANVTLSWKAGAGGTHNAASYYEIIRRESTDGSTWGNVEIIGTTTALSYSVPPPSTPGNYYMYFVRLVGTAGEAYASDSARCSSALRNPPISSCAAPSGVTLSSSTSTGANVTLSWKAGAGGTHNAASHYEIARKESTDGSTWGNMVTVTTTSGLSCSVAPPKPYGNHYRYYVRLVGAAGTSYASAWVLCKTSLQKVRPALVPYTDEPVEAGTTRIKAVHILELRTNVDRLRQGLGLAAYAYTEIRAGYTSLARWRAHVLELRAAIDEMGTTHEAWLNIPVNRPTAAAMQQLRRVVASV